MRAAGTVKERCDLGRTGCPVVVTFEFKKAPAYRVVFRSWTGAWSDRRIRSEFERIERWATRNKIRTGRWIFREPAKRSWEACIEVRGQVRVEAPFRLKTLAPTRVARVVFDPGVVSPAVVYHGLSDWLRWRRKDGQVRSVGASREVYLGNPWTDRGVERRTDVQFVVRP